MNVYCSKIRGKKEIKGRFVVDSKGRKFFEISNRHNHLFIPIKLIDKLREEEWVYDTSGHNKRKTD